MTSCKTPTNRMLLIYAFMMATLVFAPLSAFADKKSDLYAKGVKSMGAGGNQDLVDARDAFCQLKKDDPEYNDGAGTVSSLCDQMAAAVTRAQTQNKIRFGEGNDLLTAGKLDEAEAKFKSVKFGDYVA